MLQLERKLKEMGKGVGGVVDEVYESVDEAVDGVQHSLKKQERKWEKWERKVREVEEVVGGMNAKLYKSQSQGIGRRSVWIGRMLIRCLCMCFRSGFWTLTRRITEDCMGPLYTRPHPQSRQDVITITISTPPSLHRHRPHWKLSLRKTIRPL